MSTLHYRTCPLCEATCGLELQVDGDVVTRIRGDRDDVFSKGFICPKGSVLHHVHADPDRLRQPLIKQADGSHAAATWDEAFAEIERRLLPLRERDGAASTAVYIGNPNVHGSGLVTLQGVMQTLATTNVYTARSVDQASREAANGFVFGDPGAYGVPDLDRTELLVLIGANPVASNGSLATAPDWPGRIDRIRERGGHVIVIDPRRTETADRSDEWLGIRPGTDALLLAAIANVIFAEDLSNLRAASQYVDNVEAVTAAVASFTPEAVAGPTGIAAETIRELARRIAQTDRTALYGRVGLHTNAFGTVSSWLTDVVTIITGNLDRDGGTMFATPAAPMLSDLSQYPDGFVTGRWTSRVGGHPECQGELPIATLADEILTPGEGQVTSMICLAGNPARSAPDSVRMEEALASLECLVAVDIYRNETSQYAHVILPPASHLERSHYDLFFYPMGVRNVANWSPALFEPNGPTEADIHLRLTGLLSGMGPDADLAFLRDMTTQLIAGAVLPELDAEAVAASLSGETVFDRFLDLMLRVGPYGAGLPDFGVPGRAAEGSEGLSLDVLAANPHGVDLGPLQSCLPDRLGTPNGRINLLPAAIEADLPRLHALLAAGTQGGFSLIGRRYIRSNNSWMHNIRVLRKGRNRCTLMVNPADAETLGVADGALVQVDGEVGSVIVPAEITDAIVPGVVSLPHGYGHEVDGQAVANANPGVNSNRLTDPGALDPISGACSINGIPVRLALA